MRRMVLEPFKRRISAGCCGFWHSNGLGSRDQENGVSRPQDNIWIVGHVRSSFRGPRGMPFFVYILINSFETQL
jgi:hypothetical protein